MADVGHGEPAGESHHHVNRSGRKDPATHRRAAESPEDEQWILREEVSTDPSRDHQPLVTTRVPALPLMTHRLCRSNFTAVTLCKSLTLVFPAPPGTLLGFSTFSGLILKGIV